MVLRQEPYVGKDMQKGISKEYGFREYFSQSPTDFGSTLTSQYPCEIRNVIGSYGNQILLSPYPLLSSYKILNK